MQEKFARLFMSIASELWLRDAIDTVEEVFTLTTLVVSLVTLNSFAVGQIHVTVPPSPFYLFYVFLWFWAV